MSDDFTYTSPPDRVEHIKVIVNKPWIGVDLDGTLAEYHGWVDITHIGAPVPKMVERVKKWLAEGKQVKILTARVAIRSTRSAKERDECIRAIWDWCKKHVGKVLPVVAEKDTFMEELWDDRCVQVRKNTGISIEDQLVEARHLIKTCLYCDGQPMSSKLRCRIFDFLNIPHGPA
jgi:hypothetical protein